VRAWRPKKYYAGPDTYYTNRNVKSEFHQYITKRVCVFRYEHFCSFHVDNSFNSTNALPVGTDYSLACRLQNHGTIQLLYFNPTKQSKPPTHQTSCFYTFVPFPCTRKRHEPRASLEDGSRYECGFNALFDIVHPEWYISILEGTIGCDTSFWN